MTTAAPSPHNPALRLAWIIEALLRVVGIHVAKGTLAPSARNSARDAAGRRFANLVLNRLRGTATRFAILFAKLQNDVPPSRPRLPAPSRRAPRPAPNLATHPMVPLWGPLVVHHLPSRFAWLHRLVPEAAPSTGMMRQFVADPEIQALIAADPRVGRILRPLCRALGVSLPPCLQRPPRPRAPTPEPTAESPGGDSARPESANPDLTRPESTPAAPRPGRRESQHDPPSPFKWRFGS